ncbi:MAG: hypothetical protein QOG87_326, partial [Actinomycetota bacterium]
MDDVKTVSAMWDTLNDRDWQQLGAFFGPASIYYDVPPDRRLPESVLRASSPACVSGSSPCPRMRTITA